MDISNISPTSRIERIEKSQIPVKRYRYAGKNARLGDHGIDINFPCVRVSSEGVDGFGWSSRLTGEEAATYVNKCIIDFFDSEGLIKDEYANIEFALLDWLGHVAKKPVYKLAAGDWFDGGPSLSVPCYDSTLYFDELHIEDDEKAAEYMAKEALEGQARGHTAFKIKIGRGNMHMPLKEGMRRDIMIVKKIRETMGPDAKIMVDANNGFNVNLTKEFLAATADCRLYWIEEPFFEDVSFYKNIRQWMKDNGLNVLFADGEGAALPGILEWAEQKTIDIIQYDINSYGFCKWIKLGKRLDKAGVLSAPHNYGSFHGNFTAAHLYPAIKNFAMAEMDECISPGIEHNYKVQNGRLQVPDAPGLGSP